MFSPEMLRQKISYVQKAGTYFENFLDYRAKDLEGNEAGIAAIRSVMFIALDDMRYSVIHIASESGFKNIDSLDRALRSLVESQIIQKDLSGALSLILPYIGEVLRAPKLDNEQLVRHMQAMPNVCDAFYQAINQFLAHVAPGV